MLLILIIALIASIRISRVVSEKGYDPRKAKRYPWLYAGVALLSGFIFARGSDAVLVALHAIEVVRVFFSWAVNLFVIAIYLAAISRLWKSVQILPARRGVAENA